MTKFDKPAKMPSKMKSTRDLERRVAQLEVARGEPIVVRVLALTGGPLASITCGNRTWTREPGESVDAFRERAVAKGLTVADSPLVVLVEHNERSEALHGGW